MNMLESNVQPIKLAISAMGGQGGGVLSNWIRDMAEVHGYLAQSTSVPGVAQRTGATTYYLELFPREEAERIGKSPVLGMTPIPGDVDILIASELVEAGRAVQRGLVTPDKTTLISTTHRAYTVAEKEQMGNGLSDSAKILEVMESAAKICVAFDMEKLARETGSVISSVLFGALAGTKVLPFERESFEEAIRKGGIAVTTNLAAFDAAYRRAESPRIEQADDTKDLPVPANAQTAAGQLLLDRVKAGFPASCQGIICEGVRQLVDYQDHGYAALYLDRLDTVAKADNAEAGNYQLTREVARYLALWMAFQDTIRVADQKVRRERFERIRQEVKAETGQFVYAVEFLHPRVEEICDSMPNRLGGWVLSSPKMTSLISRMFCKGRQMQTGKLSGYLLLYVISRLRFMRRSTYRYNVENKAIEGWLERILVSAAVDLSVATGVAEAQRLIKGYGDTHARGLKRFNAVMKMVDDYGSRVTAEDVRSMTDAALAHEDGKAFDTTTEKMSVDYAAA